MDTQVQKCCAECGDVLKGRTDKKFCSDMCRNAYNNKLNSDANNYMRQVNHILRKNRRILEETLPGDKISVPRQKLVDLGFNFNYFTHQRVTRNNHVYTFCYEYGYFPLENNFVLLVKSLYDQVTPR